MGNGRHTAKPISVILWLIPGVSSTLHFFNLHRSQALPTLAIPRRRAWHVSGLTSNDTDGFSSRSRFGSGSTVFLMALCFFLVESIPWVDALEVIMAMMTGELE